MNQYIVIYMVSIFNKEMTCYIQRVISYKKGKFKKTVDINKAHKYKTEKTAIKAAQNFNGEIKLYDLSI